MGRYTTTPNPRVGCVVAHGSEIVGEGWHRKKGEPHAEPHALHAAGERARDATVYVSLEPHCFQGRTPPCTDALIRAGVKRVVCAMLDPHPRVAGHGVRQLQTAGVQVDVGLLEREATELNRGYIKRLTQGLPFLSVKIAASVDGRTALSNGVSQWITSAEARADVQHLRAAACAVMTGIGTILKDDPRLTVRDPGIDMLGRQPLRVILDSKGRLPANAKVFDQPGTTLVMHGRNAPALNQRGEFVEMPLTATGSLDLNAVLELLAARECNEVLVEAGATLAGQVIAHGVADEVIVYLAPMLLGHDGLSMARLGPWLHLADAPQFEFVDVRPVGRDVRLTLRPVR